ncbi:hypothetical protein [Agromyces ramosus]|uniref:Uncharacterized protein n=1 Tax=Agromyces ramosus TaxID=33879 RepID=A0ABU0RA34_9MICO|nr:hypothetical protein [Agromyces ramosus]MDQ0894627.1 hypothetical protein [Agromyces ramosus]
MNTRAILSRGIAAVAVAALAVTTALAGATPAVADHQPGREFPVHVELVGAVVPGGQVTATFEVEHAAVPGATARDSTFVLAVAVDQPGYLAYSSSTCPSWQGVFVGDTCLIPDLDALGTDASFEVTYNVVVPTVLQPRLYYFGEVTGEVVQGFVSDPDGQIAVPIPEAERGSDAAPAVLDVQVFDIGVNVEPDYGFPGGPQATATITVEHTGELPPFVAVELDLGITWSPLLTLVEDPATVTPCVGGLVAGVCTLAGMLDEDIPPGGVTITLNFAIPETDTGVGWVEAEGLGGQYQPPPPPVIGFAAVDAGAGDIVLAADPGWEDLPPEWLDSDSDSMLIDDALVILDVELDRDMSWPGGPAVTATVHVTQMPRPDFEFGDIWDDLTVGFVLTWPDFLTAAGPPAECTELDGDVCLLELEPGVTLDVVFPFESPSAGVGTGDIAAEAERLIDGPINDGTALPTEWVVPDAEPFTVQDASVTVDLVLDRAEGYAGGKQLTATTTVTHVAATPVEDAADGAFPDLTAELRFDWPGFLTMTTDSGCDSFDVVSRVCVVDGLDAVGASVVITMTFAMPGVSTPAAPATEVPPRTGDVIVDGVKLSFTPPSPAPVPGGPPPPAASDDPISLPTAWLGGDREPFTVYQPAVRVSPGIAKPGDAVAVFVKYLPPGEQLELSWQMVHPPTAVPVAGVFRVDAGATVDRWPILILRNENPGQRVLVVHSVNGLFGDIRALIPLLVVPRTAMAPDFIGRGG